VTCRPRWESFAKSLLQPLHAARVSNIFFSKFSRDIFSRSDLIKYDVLIRAQTPSCAVTRGASVTWQRVWTRNPLEKRYRAPGDVCRAAKEVQAIRSSTLSAKRRTSSWANTHPTSKCPVSFPNAFRSWSESTI